MGVGGRTSWGDWGLGPDGQQRLKPIISSFSYTQRYELRALTHGTMSWMTGLKVLRSPGFPQITCAPITHGGLSCPWYQGPCLSLPFSELCSGASPLPRGREIGRTMWKEMEGQVVTYIGTFGTRETHDTRLPTSPLRTWRSRATIFSSGSLKERTQFSEQTL